LSDKSSQWERSNEKSIYSRSSAHSIGSSVTLEAKIDAMINKFDNVLSSNQMNQAPQASCYKCNEPSHIADQCPYSLEQINAFNRVRNDAFAPTYNPGWRNHPNFSWSQNNANTNLIQPPFQSFPNNSSNSNPPFQPKQFQPNFSQPSQNQAQQSFVPQDDKRMTSLEQTMESLAKATTQNIQSNSILNELLTSHMQSTS